MSVCVWGSSRRGRLQPARAAGLHAAIVIVIALAAASAGARQEAEDPVRQLQGRWTVTAAEQSGRPFDVIKGGVLAITGRAFAIRTATGNELAGTIEVDVTASPRRIDFLHGDGSRWEGIYSVSGETLRLNYVEAGDGLTRPTLFATSDELMGTVIVMRRTPAP